MEVEELLGAMSLVLNGGGLAQLQTINRELGEALEGRESAIKATLDELDTFIGGLDQQKEEINRALESADALAATLAARTATIENALDTIAPGLEVLDEQRGLLVSMLEGLARLGEVGTRVIEQSAENTVADLQLLQPILTQLVTAGPDLAGSLPLLVTYPFPDSSLTALNYRQAQTGGYALFTNMTATVNLDLTELLCRYGIDNAGALVEVDPTTIGPEQCGVPGPDDQGAGGRHRRGRGAARRPHLVRRPRALRARRHAAARRRRRRGPARLPVGRGTAVITRKTKLKLLAFAALALLGLSYVSFRYVGLDRALLGNGYEVAADFRDSGGIFVNAEVTNRGVAVGRVTDMLLVEDGVRVVLTIDPGADPIPADAEAVVATRSAVGEQYVDLRPQSDDGPFLAEGAVIPQSRTDIPVPVEQMLLHIDGLVGSLDEENLRILVDELGRAFEGSGDDLGRLIDNGDLLLARAEESLPQTLKLITDGQTVLQTQVDGRSAIRAVGRRPPAGERHVRGPRSRAARHPRQRPRRERGARRTWSSGPGRGSGRWCATSTS